MHHPTDRIAHTTAFVTPAVEHWLEQEIAQWVHPMKDRSDDPSHHERTLLPRELSKAQCYRVAHQQMRHEIVLLRLKYQTDSIVIFLVMNNFTGCIFWGGIYNFYIDK